jgi:phosphotransferase system HPr (HPr) family protein
MAEREVRVVNRHGLHARPAIQFVQKANEFRCDITIIKGQKKANAKSISQLIALKVRQDDTVLVKTQGEGEEEAATVLTSLLSSENR